MPGAISFALGENQFWGFIWITFSPEAVEPAWVNMFAQFLLPWHCL